VKKLFEEILLEYRCNVKRVKHEWQKKRDFGEELKKKRRRRKKDGSRRLTDHRTTINHLPSLLPLLTDF